MLVSEIRRNAGWQCADTLLGQQQRTWLQLCAVDGGKRIAPITYSQFKNERASVFFTYPQVYLYMSLAHKDP